MAISLKDAVYSKPTFEKVAELELPKDVSRWNEEIMNQFYSEVSYLPKDVGVNVIVNTVDENKGYAKGSVVVFYGDKKVNYPVIVKDFKLSPFDVFVIQKGEGTIYVPSTAETLAAAMSSKNMGILENWWGRGGYPFDLVKTPGGIYPKVSINIDEQNVDQFYPPFSKMSGWRKLARKEDLEKLAIQMASAPNVSASFVDNTGDLIGNLIKLKDDHRPIADDHKEGILDLNDVVKAKRAITIMDSDMLDPSSLVPISPPSVCEIRVYEYPSMEDFIESGASMVGRFEATRLGKPIAGVVLDMKDISDSCECTPVSESEDGKNLRNRRDQIFISADGKHYSKFSDWNKTGVGFYGTGVLNAPGSMEKVVAMIGKNTSDDFSIFNRDNKNDGSDKLFNRVHELDMGKGINGYADTIGEVNEMLILYGAGDAWECFAIRGSFRKFSVNNSNVYVSNEYVIIPANVAGIQKVSGVENPVYKMIIGKAKNIYVIPEASIIINTFGMNCIKENDIMRPSKTVQSLFEEAEIGKVAVCVADKGYRITGEPFAAIDKLAGIYGNTMTTNDALTSLQIMGMTKTAATEALKVAMLRFADPDSRKKSVVIYGVRGDYLDGSVLEGREKTASAKKALRDYAYSIRRNLVKEASILQDPEAVDVVLSLNFINEDSISNYIENLTEIKRINSELAQMLIASRMGLSDLDEAAIKKAISGLNDVIKGLEDLKYATTQA
jgi:hypothetical protein